MLYNFQVMPSLSTNEPAVGYFDELVSKARSAISQRVTLVSAWQICEYLDSVDAGDIKMERELYSQCVNHLSHFLMSHGNSKNVQSLVSKSWAASTLKDILYKESSVVRPMPFLRVA